MLRRLLVAGAAAGVFGGTMVLAAYAANDVPPIRDGSAPTVGPGQGPPPKGAAFLGVGALAAIVVGGYYYQPYGLVEVEPPACTGVTDEGCELRMTEVPTEDGEVVPQCVQFCPQVQE